MNSKFLFVAIILHLKLKSKRESHTWHGSAVVGAVYISLALESKIQTEDAACVAPHIKTELNHAFEDMLQLHQPCDVRRKCEQAPTHS